MVWLNWFEIVKQGRQASGHVTLYGPSKDFRMYSKCKIFCSDLHFKGNFSSGSFYLSPYWMQGPDNEEIFHDISLKLFFPTCECESCSHVWLFVTPMDYTVHGILQARILEWVAFPFSRESSQLRIEPRSPTLQEDSLPSEPPGKPQLVHRKEIGAD